MAGPTLVQLGQLQSSAIPAVQICLLCPLSDPALGPSFFNNQDDLRTSKIYSLIRTKVRLKVNAYTSTLTLQEYEKCNTRYF